MSVHDLPSEMIQKIFYYLNWNDLKTCAAVSKEWDTAANETSELKWKNLCKAEFGQVYEEAYRRSRLSWEELYKSLRLWPHVKSSKIYLHYSDLLEGEDGYVGSIDSDKPKKIQLLKNGVIGYPRYTNEPSQRLEGRWGYCNSISYYDPETLAEIDRVQYDFEFNMYEENDDLIVMRGKELNLHIVTKANKKVHHVAKMLQYEWGDYSMFYLVKNMVFYITKGHKIWMCKLVFVNGEPTIRTAPFAQFDLFPALNKIEAFAYINDNQVNVLTGCGYIYSIVEQQMHELCHVKKEMDNRNEVINALKHHGFEWSIPEVYRWICNHDIIGGDWVAITHLKKAIVCSYDRVVFIGTSRRTLHVYYNPYLRGQLKLYNRRPTLTIDLNEHIPYYGRDNGYEGLTSYQRQILQIYVMEIQNGHRVILLYCQRLVAIEFYNYPPKRPGDPLDNVATRPRLDSYIRIA